MIVRGGKPNVVVGNGFCKFDRPLLAELLEKSWENGARL